MIHTNLNPETGKKSLAKLCELSISNMNFIQNLKLINQRHNGPRISSAAFRTSMRKAALRYIRTCADPESFARGDPTLACYFFMFFYGRRGEERIHISQKVGQHLLAW